jgi:hypothetical protein
MKRDVLERAIKGQKWDKYSYSYAINAMQPGHPAGMFITAYTLKEIKDIFFSLAHDPTMFDKIHSFTTFKNL